MGELASCFNDVVRSLEALELDTLVQESVDMYLPVNANLGFTFSNHEEFELAVDAMTLVIWPFQDGDPETPDVPSEIRDAAAVTQVLTGYAAGFLTQKAFIESSFNSTSGSPDTVYGYYQLSRDAAREGIEQLMNMPTSDMLVQIVPEFQYFRRGEVNEILEQDPALADEILDSLRSDPMASSLIAAGYNIRYAGEFSEGLTSSQGYLIHYLGPGNFNSFMSAYRETPDINAYEALNGGAESPVLRHSANRAIFFSQDENGEDVPRTLQEVFDFLEAEKDMGNHIIFQPVEESNNCLILHTSEDAQERYQNLYGAPHPETPAPE